MAKRPTNKVARKKAKKAAAKRARRPSTRGATPRVGTTKAVKKRDSSRAKGRGTARQVAAKAARTKPRRSTARMAKRPEGKTTRKKPIEQYDHPDKERANNPPVGLVTPQTDPDSRMFRFARSRGVTTRARFVSRSAAWVAPQTVCKHGVGVTLVHASTRWRARVQPQPAGRLAFPDQPG